MAKTQAKTQANEATDSTDEAAPTVRTPADICAEAVELAEAMKLKSIPMPQAKFAGLMVEFMQANVAAFENVAARLDAAGK